MKMIKTNFLNRDVDNATFLGVDVPNLTGLLSSLHPGMQEATNDPFLKRLITRAHKNGILFRNAASKEFRNYWLPLANAGLAAVPRPTHFHESCFMMHDILHHNFPDLLIDKKSPLGRRVYIIHRVLGEALTLVLADAFSVDLSIKSGKTTDVEKPSEWIYPPHAVTFPTLSSDLGELKKAMIANARFAVLGEFHESDDLKVYQNNFKVIYEGDMKWTAHNFDNFKVSDEWSSWVKSFEHPCILSLSTFIHQQSLFDDMKNEEIMENILEWYFKIIFGTDIVSADYDSCNKSATELFILFNSKGMLEYGYSFEALNQDMRDLALTEFFEKALALNPKRETQGGIFPLFDNMYISYNGDKQEKATLAEISHRILDESKQLFLFKNLINLAGGKLERSQIVTKPGVVMINKTVSTIPNDISELMKLNSEYSDTDLNAKITYMDNKVDLFRKVFCDYEHTSIANNVSVSFLLAGVSINTLLEFCSSSAKMSRTNTDDAQLHLNSLYAITDRREIKFIEQFYRTIREEYKSVCSDDLELQNRFNLKQQAMACSVSFSLEDWTWFLKKRFNTKFETELFIVCKEIYKQLRKEFDIFPEIEILNN